MLKPSQAERCLFFPCLSSCFYSWGQPARKRWGRGHSGPWDEIGWWSGVVDVGLAVVWGAKAIVRRLPMPPKYIHQSRVLRFVCGAEFHPNQVQCIACPWSGLFTGFSPDDAGTAGRVGQMNGMRAIGMWKHILAFSLLHEFQNCLLLSGDTPSLDILRSWTFRSLIFSHGGVCAFYGPAKMSLGIWNMYKNAIRCWLENLSFKQQQKLQNIKYPSILGLSRVLWWPKLCHFFLSRFILVQMLDQTQKIWHDLSRLLVQQTTTFKRIWLIPFWELFLASDIGGPLWNLGWCHFLLQIWN